MVVIKLKKVNIKLDIVNPSLDLFQSCRHRIESLYPITSRLKDPEDMMAGYKWAMTVQFEIGESYLDDKGEYTVVALSGKRLQIRREDGTERVEDADLKARIHQRILRERTGGSPYVSGSKRQSRSGEQAWFFEIIAEILDHFGKTSTKFVSHDELLESFLEHPEAGPALEYLSREDPQGKSKQWWAANHIAWWSQRWTMGYSRYDYRFERRKVNGVYEYRKLVK